MRILVMHRFHRSNVFLLELFEWVPFVVPGITVSFFRTAMSLYPLLRFQQSFKCLVFLLRKANFSLELSDWLRKRGWSSTFLNEVYLSDILLHWCVFFSCFVSREVLLSSWLRSVESCKKSNILNSMEKKLVKIIHRIYERNYLFFCNVDPIRW